MLTDRKLVDVVIDACFNQPYNNPSRQFLAKRHELSADDIRRAQGDDNWVLIRKMVLEELVRIQVTDVFHVHRVALENSNSQETPIEAEPPDTLEGNPGTKSAES